MQHLTQFFAMQALTAREGSEWPKLRAVLEVNEPVPYIRDVSGFKLTVYANGLPTWCKECEVPGRPEPRGVANDLMGDVLREAALSGLCTASRRRRKLNRCHPAEAPKSLPEETVKGELFPL